MTRSARDVIASEISAMSYTQVSAEERADRILSRLSEDGWVLARRDSLSSFASKWRDYRPKDNDYDHGYIKGLEHAAIQLSELLAGIEDTP